MGAAKKLGFLLELENLIRVGNLSEVRKQLLALDLGGLSRSQIETVVDLARRVNMPKLALQALRPIIRPEWPIFPPPTQTELAIYADCLSRIGVYDEAQKILEKLDGDLYPQIYFYKASNYIYQWNDAAAIPLLKKYIRFSSLDIYQRQVGQVNLAQSLIAEDNFQEAEDLLEEIREEISESRDEKKLMLGYTYLLSAQILIYQKKYVDAKPIIEKALSLLQNSKSRYELYTKSWKAILDLLERPQDAEVLTKLRNIRSELIKSEHWEATRNSEFFEALALRNDDLFIRVLNGSSHASYRQRIRKLYDPQFSVHRQITVTPDPMAAVSELKVFKMNHEYTLSPLLFRLFQVLSRDLYRPIALGFLISQLYPKEFFNPESSPQKALQAIKLLRQWFQKNQIPLVITIQNENIKLSAVPSYAVQIMRFKKDTPEFQHHLKALAHHFGVKTFTRKEVSAVLSLPSKKVTALIDWALAKRKLKKTSSGRSTRFRFTTSA